MRFNKVTAKLGGEDRLFIFTMSTLAEFCKMRGINPSNISEEMYGANRINAERDMMLASWRLGYQYNDEQAPDINSLKFEELISEMEQSEYDKVIMCFVNSMKVPETKAEPTAKKKTKQ